MQAQVVFFLIIATLLSAPLLFGSLLGYLFIPPPSLFPFVVFFFFETGFHETGWP